MLALILPRGITGTNVPKRHDGPDPRVFRADCEQVTAARHGRAEDRPQGPYTSFVAQELVLPKGEVTALSNKFHPWVGFCVAAVYGPIDFVDPPVAVAEAFVALGRYRLLSKAELDLPVVEDMCVDLRDAEVKNIRYWGQGRPLRVGDVVFNYWD
jgi:hypothetical protein